MEVDRIFVLPGGLPLKNGTLRHAIFGEDGNTVFPGIHDLLERIKQENEQNEEQEEWRKDEYYEMLRRHISDLMVAVLQAASHLRPFHFV